MDFARTTPKACSHPWLFPVVVNDWHGALMQAKSINRIEMVSQVLIRFKSPKNHLGSSNSSKDINSDRGVPCPRSCSCFVHMSTQVESESTPPTLCRFRFSCFVKISMALVHPLKPPQQYSKIRTWSPDILHWPDIIIAFLEVNRKWTQLVSVTLPHVSKSPKRTTLDPILEARLRSLVHRDVSLSGCFLTELSGNQIQYDFFTPEASQEHKKWSTKISSTKQCLRLSHPGIFQRQRYSDTWWSTLENMARTEKEQASQSSLPQSVGPTESKSLFQVQKGLLV